MKDCIMEIIFQVEDGLKKVKSNYRILLTKDNKIFCERHRIMSLQDINLIRSEQNLIDYLKMSYI